MNYKTIQKVIFYSMIAFAGLGVTISCKKKTKDTVTSSSDSYVVSLRVPGSADESADYLLTSSTLTSGEITAQGKGIEQLGWCYNAQAGNTIFSFSYNGNSCTGYKLNAEGVLEEKGRYAFEAADCFAEGDKNTLVTVGAPWGGGSLDCVIQLIDASTISVKGQKITQIYTVPGPTTDTLNKWPTSVVVRGDKLFLSFYPLGGASWLTPITDTAYVSIYSYPGLDYITTIKDTRMGPIGAYGSQPSMFKDENGDIYAISGVSYSAGYTEVDKNSGILRIKNGETQFDNSYFFDVETLSGYKLIMGAYAGNGKAVCRGVANTETSDDVWAAYSLTNIICKLFVVDLINKTVTEVTDVPAHGGQYNTPFLVEDGKVFASVNNGTEAYLYAIDPTTATGVKGAKLVGNEIQLMYSTK
jgi:hypothetical protein